MGSQGVRRGWDDLEEAPVMDASDGPTPADGPSRPYRRIVLAGVLGGLLLAAVVLVGVLSLLGDDSPAPTTTTATSTSTTTQEVVLVPPLEVDNTTTVPVGG